MMSLRCQEVAAFLADYVDGTLGTEQRTVFEAHVAGCPECIAYLRDMRRRFDSCARRAETSRSPPAFPTI